MASEPKVRLEGEYLSKNASERLAADVIQSIIEKAKTGEVTIKMNNVAGKSFEVVSTGHNQLLWGVGGSSGGTT